MQHRTWIVVAVVLGLSACVQIVGIEEATLGVPNGSGGMGTSSSSGGGMTGQPCSSPTDCPLVVEECRLAVCVDGMCAIGNIPGGVVAGVQIPGDCKEIQCDGNGVEIAVDDNTDAPMVDCQITGCMNGSPMSTPAPKDTGCTTNGGTTCDGNGNCVECNVDADCIESKSVCDPKSHTCFQCDDNVKNGDESDVDCGGDRCAKCTTAKKCALDSDCVSTFCTDGVCCIEVCDGACLACNIAGSAGTCDLIAKYEDDPSYGMGMSCTAADKKACNGGGVCGAAVGEPCQGNVNCASLKCGPAKVCVKNTGEPCTVSAECLSSLCTNGLCN